MSATLRVLILEDRPLDAELMLHELRKSGFDPNWQLVETEQDYIAHLDPALDVILSDYALPQFNGLRALQLLQKRGLDIPFVIITGNVGEEVAVECMKQGAADYLLKDRLARLGQAVSQTLERKRLREERRRAETTLRESKERFRRLVEQAADAFFILDQEGRIVDLNQRACDSLGYTREKLLTLSISDFELHSDPGKVAEGWQQMVSGVPVTTQGTHRRQDGTTFPVEIRFGLVESAERPVILALVRDITQRKQAEEALRLRTQELEVLFNIASVLVQPGKFEDRATRVLEEVAHVAGADWVTFRQRDEGRQGLLLGAVAGPASLESPPIPILSDSESLAFDAIRQGKAIVVNDYAAHPDASPNIVALGMNSMVLMPVKVGDRCLGLVNVVSRKTNHFTPDLVKLLSAIADGLGVLLENAQLGRDLQASMEEMAVVDQVAKIICSTLDIDQVYERFAAEVKKLVDFDRMGIDAIDWEAGVLITKYLAGEAVSGILPGAVWPLEGSETQQVVTSGQLVIQDDIAADPMFPRDQDIVNAGLRSGIRVPLIAEGYVVGSLFLRSRRVGAYGAREARILERLAAQIAPGVENSLLYQETKQLALALESIGDAVIFLDSQGTIRFINKAFERTFGYGPDEVLGRSVNIITPSDPNSQAGGRSMLRQALAGGWTGETRRVRKNGEEFDVNLTLTPVKDPEGRVVGVIGVAQDNSERNKAEKEIQRLNMLNSRIISSSPSALAVLRGKERVVVSVNRAFWQTFRHSRGAVEGRPITEVLALEGLEKVIEEALLSKEQQEIRHTALDGSERWFTVSATPLRGEPEAAAEAEVEALLILDDVTEQRLQKETLHETARLASIGELAAGVAHELNNPLAGVMGFAELLMARPLSPSIKEDVAKIYDQARRATRVVQNLLSFARKHPPERRYKDVTAVIARAVELKAYDLATSNIHVTFDFPADIPLTMADGYQLQQVFLNIIINAEQAIVEHRGTGTIDISGRKAGDYIALNFTDNGPGIPAGHLKRIFDPFFTTKEVGKGTGLGLSICYGIINEHGGNIWAESQVGNGTTFHIELPILPSEACPEQQRVQL